MHRAGCSGAVNLTLDSGVLMLSDGPGDYYEQMDCKWNIEAQGPITVVLAELRTKDVDVLTITEAGSKPRIWSGELNPLPQSFTSIADRITVTFTSKTKSGVTGSSGLSGFRLELYAPAPGGTRAPTAVPTSHGAGTALFSSHIGGTHAQFANFVQMVSARTA